MKNKKILTGLLLFIAFSLFSVENNEKTINAIEERLQAFTEDVYAQVKTYDESLIIYQENMAAIQQTDRLTSHQRNYYLAQNEYLMGKTYQLFSSPEIVIEHNRRMRGGAAASLTRHYSNIDKIHNYYERAIDLLNKNIDERESDKDYCLKAAVLGDLCLVKNVFFVMVHGPSISKLVDKALKINPYNTKAIIIQAASKAYPTKTWGGNPDEAIKILEPLLTEEKYPISKEDYFDIYNGLGYSYARVGDYQRAEMYLNKAQEIFPTNNYANGIGQIIKNREI